MNCGGGAFLANEHILRKILLNISVKIKSSLRFSPFILTRQLHRNIAEPQAHLTIRGAMLKRYCQRTDVCIMLPRYRIAFFFHSAVMEHPLLDHVGRIDKKLVCVAGGIAAGCSVLNDKVLAAARWDRKRFYAVRHDRIAAIP